MVTNGYAVMLLDVVYGGISIVLTSFRIHQKGSGYAQRITVTHDYSIETNYDIKITNVIS